jgi:hypothetical protein
MLALFLAIAMTPQLRLADHLQPAMSTMHVEANACPITIGIAQNGTIFSDRFNGWYKTTPKTLESVLQAGCYPDSAPNPISSVNVAVAPGASKARTDLVFSILSRQGWPKNKVHTYSWSEYPQQPSR